MNAAPSMQKTPIRLTDVTDTSVAQGGPDCVAIAESLAPAVVLKQVLSNGFWHVCQRGGFEYDKEVRSAEALLRDGTLFRRFPVAAILSPELIDAEAEKSALLCESVFDNSGQKREALDVIVNAMNGKGFSKTLCEDATSVADELFTNAIFNAPFVDTKTHLNPGVSRHNFEVKLAAGKSGRIFLAADDTRLVVGCEDPFGSLGLARYLAKIKATYDHGAAATMNFGPGGAGLGSYIIFNTGCSFYAGVWPGERTVLCCVMPLGLSNRKRTLLPKNIHLVSG